MRCHMDFNGSIMRCMGPSRNGVSSLGSTWPAAPSCARGPHFLPVATVRHSTNA